MSIHRITSTSDQNYFSTNMICSGCLFYEMLCWALQTAPYGSQGSQAASVNHKCLWSTALWTLEANWWGVCGTRRQLVYKLPRLAGCTTVLVSQTLACCNCLIDWTATVSLGLRVGHKAGGQREGPFKARRCTLSRFCCFDHGLTSSDTREPPLLPRKQIARP